MLKAKRILVMGVVCLFAFTLATSTFSAQSGTITPPATIVDMNNLFKQIAEKVMPAIVFIKVTRVTTRQPVHPFFRHFFRGNPQQQQRQPERNVQGVGSGVIINNTGHIVTNYHVIKGATGISVVLVNNQEFKVQVIGSDEETDIAVLKIIGDTSKIKFANMGNSDNVRSGELVFALGNPFGLKGTITQGIVSATSRQAGESYGYDFIQTDAAINPGNSGGALVNIYGDVIGINRMIYTRTGGYMGIGFAIPINRVRDVVAQIVKHGKVTRGFLGIVPANPDEDASQRIRLATGVKVAEVIPNSPADKAGIKPWDVIIRINGSEVQNFGVLKRMIALTPPGTSIKMVVIRNNKQITLTVKLVSRELAANNEWNWGGDNATPPAGQTADIFGMIVRNMRPNERQEAAVTHGVVVSDVRPNTPALNAGVMKGDIILEIESLKLSSIARAKKILDIIKDKTTFQMRIKRSGTVRFIVVER